MPGSERKALARLVQAARILDPLFVRQSWAGSEAWMTKLARDTTPLAQARLRLFLLNQGPWDRLANDAPFLPGVPEKPASGNFYPAGASKDDVSRWLSTLPPEERARATGFFTTIRRAPDGRFTVVPYSLEYQGELARAAALLREAATATAQPALRSFLEARAAALLNDDYAASDVAWMQLDTTIDPTFGPYETYEDGWFNQKAAFEAYVTVVDAKETEKLKRFSSQLQALENALPMEDRYKNPKIGALAPIRVVNSLFASGDGNRGVQTAAYNLPNDERTVAAHGSKRIMLRNIDLAKFEKTLVPIAKIAIAPELLKLGAVRPVLHPDPHARADARHRPAADRGERAEDDAPRGDPGALEHHRGVQGRRGRHLGDAAARRPGRAAGRDRQDARTDLPRRHVPLDPLRPQRGAREGHGGPAELAHRRGRVQVRRRRTLHPRAGEVRAGHSSRWRASCSPSRPPATRHGRRRSSTGWW